LLDSLLQEISDKSMKAVRWVTAFLVFLGVICNYMLRISINLAIVQMIAPEKTYDNLTATVTAASTIPTTTPASKTFDWSVEEKSWVLGAFFYGYIVLQVPGGRLAEKYGTRLVLGLSMFFAALLSLMTPLVASISPWAVVVLRVIQGLLTSPTIPSISPLTLAWCPRNERAKFISFMIAGTTVGTVVTYPLAGTIMDHLGWEEVFYVTGALAMVWCLLWYAVVTDRPERNYWISESELNYIVTGRQCEEQLIQPQNNVKEPPLWQVLPRMLNNRPVWVVMMSNFAHCWGLHMILVMGPTFVDTMLVTDSNNRYTKNALLTTLPFIAFSISCQVSGVISDIMTASDRFSPLYIQKLFVTLTFVPPALGVLLVGYTVDQPVLCIACITFTFAFSGCLSAGHIQNLLMLAPNKSGTLMGLSNGFGNISGAVTPLLAGYLVSGSAGLKPLVGWRVLFLSGTLFYLLAWLLFMTGAGDRQQPFDTYSPEMEKLLKQRHQQLLRQQERKRRQTSCSSTSTLSTIPEL